MKQIHLLIFFIAITHTMAAQNVGIGTTTPASKLHVKGSADISQLIIEANNTQSNTNPLIKLRNSSGADLLWIHSDHTTNTFVGLTAGRLNNASGGGTFNTFIGSGAGYSNTTGHDNTAIGDGALLFNTTGYENVATGGQALAFNTTGYSNTASGYHSLYSNTTGFYNTATGNFALYANTTGAFNIASGYQALYSNSTGSNNIANGYGALYSNTTGDNNTANGNGALFLNTTGGNNTSYGYGALYSNTTGHDNTANGYAALYVNSTGHSNTAYGTQALYSNSTGAANTAIGGFALNSNTGGSGNIAIGYGSGTAPGFPNLTNTIGIGNDGVYQHGGSNQTIIGNFSMIFIGGKVNWGIPSDGRIKNNIKEDVKGLEFILRLRPVTYHISNKAITTITGAKETSDFPGKYDCEKIKYSGFIAQEVEQAAKAANYEFSGYDTPKNEFGLYTIKYAEFVVPLVKAVQELSEQTVAQKKIIEQQQKKIEQQQLQYETLLKRVEALEKIN